jgi:hypothetical protein
MVDERDESGVDREALRAWGEDWTPPPGLREKTHAAARERGLVGVRPSRRGGLAWPAIAAAAAALAFTLGLGVGRRPAVPAPPAAAPSATSDLYMLLLYEDAGYGAPTTPEDHRARVQEYSGWARETAQGGRYVDGNELTNEGRWCRPSGDGIEVADPLVDPARGSLGGYFVIGAASLDEALAVTRGCPHLRHGGTVEVRRIAGS